MFISLSQALGNFDDGRTIVPLRAFRDSRSAGFSSNFSGGGAPMASANRISMRSSNRSSGTRLRAADSAPANAAPGRAHRALLAAVRPGIKSRGFFARRRFAGNMDREPAGLIRLSLVLLANTIQFG